MTSAFQYAFGLLMALISAPSFADPLRDALLSGGVVILIRHAQTEPGFGDPPGFRIDDCSTQRNLSAEGRAQAQRIGEWLKRTGTRVDEVLSSRWCRCRDTARLAFPQLQAQPFAPLDSFFDDRSRESLQSEAVRRQLRDLKPPRNVALVTHMVNIAALTGQVAQAGEAIIARPTTQGDLRVIGRLVVP